MKKYLFWIILSFSYFIVNDPAASQNWSALRNHEAMLFSGYSIPQFISAPISHIFVCAYNEQDNSWRELTTQVDELDGDSGYFGTNYNKTLDAVDELLFMAGEAGDYAPPSSWLNDQDSRQYVRYQFALINPDDPLNKKYVYVFRSSTYSHDPNLPYYYINYIPPSSGASDTVKAAAYLAGHNSKGVPDVWKIADSNGAYGPDILDRQKARVNGKYKYSFLAIDYKMTEDDLNVDKLQYKRGPIRIIRDVSYKAKVSVIEVNVGTFKYFFYPYSIVALGTNRLLDTDYGVKLIRQSFDLNEKAIGMLFNNNYNSDLLIDGQPDAIVTTVQQSPFLNWYSCSGNPGTAIMLYEFTTPENATESLYYQESLSGKTLDGTDDTGDKKSYGDAGIMFQGDKIKGRFSLPYVAYFWPGTQSREMVTSLVAQIQQPLTQITTLDPYMPPAQIAVALPDTSGFARYAISIPVLIGNVSGLNIRSLQLAIQFDPQILQATGTSLKHALAENWDSIITNITNETIVVTMQGTPALEGSGVLVYLNFNIIGSAGRQSPLRFVQAKFNTWNPLAITKNGSFTTLPTPQVAVTIPDTTGITKTSIAIPIRIGDVTNLNITSCQIELKYSKVVLNATAVSIQSTIASGWSIQNLVNEPGSLKFDMTGTMPLQGKGTLVWVSFDVVGSPGFGTNILFKKMELNNGIPIAVPRSSFFTVYKPIAEHNIVSIPDTTLQSGGPLHSPVLILQLTNLEINSYNMTLQFDSTVLEFKNVDIAGSLTSIWGSPKVSYSPGKLNITAAGDIPVASPGPLIFIHFDVIGPDGSSTTIHFAEMSFNSGSLKAVTDDGFVQVLGVIPVELASFTAKSDGNVVTLYWNTMTESNNFGFYIQRKSDSTPEWQTVGFVPGAGTTTVPQSYAFIVTDLQPGTWYYRLQQQDFDGQIHYSSIISINSLPAQFKLHQNYPNPFNSMTMIKYELPVGEHRVSLVIYDLLGHQIKTLVDEQNQSAGVYQLSWDGRDEAGKAVASGVYFYRLQTGDQTCIKKMVLIE